MKEALVRLLQLHACSNFSTNYSVDGRICRFWTTRNERFNLFACNSFGLDLNFTQLRFNSIAKRCKTYSDFDHFLIVYCNERHTHQLDSIIISVETIIACKLAFFGNTTRQQGRVSCFFDSVSSPDQTRARSLRHRP